MPTSAHRRIILLHPLHGPLCANCGLDVSCCICADLAATTERLDRDTCHTAYTLHTPYSVHLAYAIQRTPCIRHTAHTLHTPYNWLQRKGTLSTFTAGSAEAAQGHEEQKLSEKLTLALCVA